MKKPAQDYVRVTSVLKPFTNFDGIDAQVLANAADRGTRVHACCEAYALGYFVEDVDQDCKNYFDSFKKWFDEMVEEVLFTEVSLSSREYRFYTNGVDLIAHLKGDEYPTIIDYKTPTNISTSWQLQTSAYKILAEEVLELPIDRRICVMLPKDGSRARVIEHTNHREDRQLFLNALQLYRHFNG